MAIDLCPVSQPLLDRVLTAADKEMLQNELGILADATRALRVCQNLLKGSAIPSHVDMTKLADVIKLCHDRRLRTDEQKLALDALRNAANWIRHPDPTTARALQVVTPTSRPQLVHDREMQDTVRGIAILVQSLKKEVSRLIKDSLLQGYLVFSIDHITSRLRTSYKEYGGTKSDWKTDISGERLSWRDPPDIRACDVHLQV